MPQNSEHGLVSLRSRHGVDATIANLKRILDAKGVKVFAEIDHSGEAAKAGLAMHNTKVLIFGNPKGGTPLMLASPTIALDLPLKILVWEDADGATWLTYTSVEYLRERHNVPRELMANIAIIDALAVKASE
jgi:uncharacterized protein (DUF302 family)